MKYCFDIETDGFLNQCTKIHCIVLKNIDTNEILKLDNDKAVEELEKADLARAKEDRQFDNLVHKKEIEDLMRGKLKK